MCDNPQSLKSENSGSTLHISIGSKQETRNVEEGNSENESETEINLEPPTKTEIQLVLSQLKNGKAAGLDNI